MDYYLRRHQGLKEIYNFSPLHAPPLCPRGGLLTWDVSAAELSHRSALFDRIVKEAESDLRKLLDIPEDFEVLFLPGGATMQFSGVPYNLAGRHKVSNYLTTGLPAGHQGGRQAYRCPRGLAPYPVLHHDPRP